MPLSRNPVTFSLKVAVTKNGAFIVVGDADVKATVGAVASYVRVSCVAAVLLLPAISVASAAGTSTVTGPSASGVTVKL
jgi:hypothetical protein